MMINHKRKSNMRRIKELDDSISDEYSECYVCGRTNDNLKTLIKGNITEINARIKPYEDDLVDLTAEYNESIQEILESTKDSNFLDVKISTIVGDLDTFREKIPHLDEILSSVKNKLTGQDLKYYLSEIGNDADSVPAIAKIKKRIGDLSEQKLHLQDLEKNKGYKMTLLKREIEFCCSTSAQLEVAICPICACLVERKDYSPYTI